jgi:hypothetical protein
MPRAGWGEAKLANGVWRIANEKNGALAGSVLFWTEAVGNCGIHRHCEEQSDEAIQTASTETLWIASLRSQ